jgi:hypothetical protein
MFAPFMGIEEDPATGSAVAAFAGAVRDFDDLPDGQHLIVVEQGFEMGRPSLIHLEKQVSAGALTAVRIGGNAVRVMSGTLAVEGASSAEPEQRSGSPTDQEWNASRNSMLRGIPSAVAGRGGSR